MVSMSTFRLRIINICKKGTLHLKLGIAWLAVMVRKLAGTDSTVVIFSLDVPTKLHTLHFMYQLHSQLTCTQNL